MKSLTQIKRSRKFTLPIFICAAIGIGISINGVLAANSIVINNGAAIQFGQGVSATSSCVSSLQTAITQEFVNNTNTYKVGIFGMRADFSNCGSKTLRVSLVDSSGTSVKDLVYTVVSSASNPRPDTEILTADPFILLDLSAENISAGSVKKIIVTSENS